MKLNDKINEEQGYILELNDEIGNLCKILKEKEHNLALIKEDTYITYAELTYEKSLLNRIEQSNLIIKQEAIFRSVLTLVFAIIVSLHPVAIVAIITTALFGLYHAIKLINCIKKENEIARKDVVTNEVVLIGYICKKPIYRQTPFGREIADILLAVNRAYNKSDYIPCIAWGRNARFCQNLEVGSQIKLVGRVQSRTYEKKHEDGSVETRVAYEVSVGSLEVIEENDSESTVDTENQEAV